MIVTQEDVARNVARRFVGYRAGITTSTGTLNTFVDAGLVGSDSGWLQGKGVMVGGTARLITEIDMKTGKVTFCPAMTSSAGAGSAWVSYGTSREDIAEAINSAIRSLGKSYLVPRAARNVVVQARGENDSTGFAGSEATAFAELPDGCVGVSMVSGEDESNDTPYAGLQGWSIERNLGKLYLAVPESWEGMSLRVMYYALPNELRAEDDELLPGGNAGGASDERDVMAYVEEYALHILHEMALNRNPTDAEARTHATMMRSHLDKANQLRSVMRTPAQRRQYKRRVYGEQI